MTLCSIFLSRFTHSLNGFTALALTKLDILSELDEVKIGINYRRGENQQILEHYPSSEQDFDGVTVEYLTLPGWKEDISHCRKFEDLPENAREYVLTIEKHLNIPIWWIGVGQSRESMIKRVPSTLTSLFGAY